MLLLAVPCNNQEEDDRGQSSSCRRLCHAGVLPVSSPPAHPWRRCSPVAVFLLVKTLVLFVLVNVTMVADATSTLQPSEWDE